MPNVCSQLFCRYCAAALLGLTGLSCAWGGPVVSGVTPPVWLQTETENWAVRPGMEITTQAWLTTGRGGRAVVNLGAEQVEIDENSLWEWSGEDDGSGGNVVQGGVRVGFSQVKKPLEAPSPESHQTAVLQQDALWILILEAGDSETAAQRLALFLNHSGYPVSAAQAVPQGTATSWQIWLDGFSSSEAASAMGATLTALAPGILSATPKRQ